MLDNWLVAFRCEKPLGLLLVSLRELDLFPKNLPSHFRGMCLQSVFGFCCCGRLLVRVDKRWLVGDGLVVGPFFPPLMSFNLISEYTIVLFRPVVAADVWMNGN